MPNLAELLAERRRDRAERPAIVVGIVTNNDDPEGMGRIKVKLPHLGNTDESAWARIAAPMAGRKRGFYFLPEVGDEVLVAFAHGDPRFPFILGALWNGRDPPPAENKDGRNDVRVIESRSGHVIRLTDTANGEKIEIIDSSGQNSLLFDTAAKLVKIESAQGTIRLVARQIEIEATGAATVKATGPMTLKGATIDLN